LRLASSAEDDFEFDSLAQAVWNWHPVFVDEDILPIELTGFKAIQETISLLSVETPEQVINRNGQDGYA
jgi:hypothetical protein